MNEINENRKGEICTHEELRLVMQLYLAHMKAEPEERIEIAVTKFIFGFGFCISLQPSQFIN